MIAFVHLKRADGRFLNTSYRMSAAEAYRLFNAFDFMLDGSRSPVRLTVEVVDDSATIVAVYDHKFTDEVNR